MVQGLIKIVRKGHKTLFVHIEMTKTEGEEWAKNRHLRVFTVGALREQLEKEEQQKNGDIPERAEEDISED